MLKTYQNKSLKYKSIINGKHRKENLIAEKMHAQQKRNHHKYLKYKTIIKETHTNM